MISKIILDALLNIPNSYTTGTMGQIRMRCPSCNHHNNKLYVGIMNNSDKIGYDCKHCPFSGAVGGKFLKMFDIEKTLIDEYIKVNKNANIRIQNSSNTKIKKLILKHESDSYIKSLMEKHKDKVMYLEHRLRRKITVNDIRKYKIVLDLKQLVDYNNININNGIDDAKVRKSRISLLNELSRNFIGFMISDNNKINFRKIKKSYIDERYISFTLDKTINSPFLYIPENKIDIMSVNPTIVLTEGPFDIICVKERYYLDENNSMVFSAVGTKKGYKRALYQLIKMTGFTNCSVIIYSDADADIDFYRKEFTKELSLFKFTIYYNKSNKDFGDMNNEVKIEKIVL